MYLEGVTKEHIATAAEKLEAREQLKGVGDFWVSPDITIEKPTLVEPGQNLLNQNIVINVSDLPPGVNLTRGTIGSLRVAVRSFYAQTGIEIVLGQANIPEAELIKLKEKGSALIPVDIKNYSNRAVEVSGRVMRLFWVNDQNRLRGEDLAQAVKNKDIEVEGEEGKDWYIAGFNEGDKISTTGENGSEGLSIIVKVNPEKYYIPFAKVPVKRDESVPIREQLDSLLVKIPEGEKPELEIGETPRITLGKNTVAIINTGAENGQRHINSPLIDPGSDWKIRTEMVHGQDYIEVFLYKK
jgi:hypothetical protein